MDRAIVLEGVKTNNLKNIRVEIPLKKLTTITGVSGSGKSSLVFDTLYAEGQRRYIQSLSTYTRQFLEKLPRPDIERIENIPPAIALEQKNHVTSSRPTVATMSELYDYLRLLFAKIGQIYCYQCNRPVRADTPQTVAEALNSKPTGSRFYILSILEHGAAEKNRWTQTRKALLSAGFQRILVSKKDQHELLELAETEKFHSKPDSVFLVIDRMVLPQNPTKDPRLMDALAQAFQHGLGHVALAFVLTEESGPTWQFEEFSDKLCCNYCKINYHVLELSHFSFDNPLGACPGCSGFGYNLELNEDLVVPDFRKTLKNGAIDPFIKPASIEWHEQMLVFCEKHHINIGKRYEDLTIKEKELLWNGDGSSFSGIRGCFEELKKKRYKLHVRVFIRRYQKPKLCNECKGARLRKESSAVKIGFSEQLKTLPEILALSIEAAQKYFQELKLSKFQQSVASDILKQVSNRLLFLNEVGVGYLTLNRLGKTLSGGECQRINLATQLGNKLCSTLYVLDEPSIGLHPADTQKLISLMHQLRDQGNTLVVVEHDFDLIRASDHVIELGPLAGYKGGEVIAAGSYESILHEKSCLTSQYLSGAFSVTSKNIRRKPTEKVIRITGACENNLQNLDVSFPLNLFITITGLSGSGKTTLIHQTLYNALSRIFHRTNVEVGRFYRLYGVDLIHDVVLLDQKPIGRSARSNPATYLKIWDDIRKIYANQSLSIRRGYGPSYFSFNVDGGRCPTCKGEGEVTLDMYFMAEMKLPCEECDGKKFKKPILDIEFKGKNVHKLLHTTIHECIELFRNHHSVLTKLELLKKVGLGYLELGQSSATLSGGECQRLKIAQALENCADTGLLYIFDEPTTGLHADDTKKLLLILQELVDQKNTVIVIEHNLDVIAQADWVIDLGPGGGSRGGQVIGLGSPEDISKNAQSLTGQFLKKILSH